MEKTPKEMLKAYVDSQKFNSTTEIMDAMKEMFRDVLQQVMERAGRGAGVRKKSAHVGNRCRKQSAELSQWILEKDGKHAAGSGGSEGAKGSERRI